MKKTQEPCTFSCLLMTQKAWMNGVVGHLCAHNLNAKLGQDNLLRMVR